MNKNMLKILVISFTLIFSVFFINVDGVKADGYASCYYSWTVDFGNSCGIPSGDGATYCTNLAYTYEFGYKVSSNGVEVDFDGGGSGAKINNSSFVKGQLENKYKNSKNYTCLDKVYIDYDGYGLLEDKKKVNFSITENGCTDCNKGISLSRKDVGSSGNGSNLDAIGSDDSTNHWTGPAGTAPPGTEEYDNDGSGNAENLTLDQIVGGVKSVKNPEEGITGTCELIDSQLIQFLKNLFIVIQVAGVILMVILTLIEFVKVITASSDDGLSGAFKNTIKRIIATVILLILPMIIIWIINIVNDSYSDKHTQIGDDGNPICID